MADIKDTENGYQGLMSAVRDVMMKNQNLYQQDLERQYTQYSTMPPEEVEAAVEKNKVNVPDPTDTSVTEFDADDVYSGEESGQEE